MSTRIKAGIRWAPFSRKQKKVLTWWTSKSPVRDRGMIVAHGSIRSGKTVSMIDGFVTWAMSTFENADFILAGKSVGTLERNVLTPMFQILDAKGWPYEYKRGDPKHIIIGSNRFHLFGANNEAAKDKLQGLTAAGAYADEIALFPKSFVEQMIGRCSLDGARIWANCNPEGPFHYFKTEYIDQAKEKNILVLHFTMDDNPSLSEERKQFYKSMFSGVFYKRYILGLWVQAEGLVYSMFDHDRHVVDDLPRMRRLWIGVDHGTSNATAFILCGHGVDDRLYCIDEYYHSGRDDVQKAPSRYADDFRMRYMEWCEDFGLVPDKVFIDPAAAAFKQELKLRNIHGLRSAVNDVKDGIELLSSLMARDMFRIHRRCENLLREISTYVWDEKKQERGIDEPVKEHDHALDAVRYVANGTAKTWRDLARIGISASIGATGQKVGHTLDTRARRIGAVRAVY